MPEKGAMSPTASFPWATPRPNPLLQQRLGALTAAVFLVMLVVLTIDGSDIKSFIKARSFPQDYVIWRLNGSISVDQNYQNLTLCISYVPQNLTHQEINPNLTHFSPEKLENSLNLTHQENNPNLTNFSPENHLNRTPLETQLPRNHSDPHPTQFSSQNLQNFAPLESQVPKKDAHEGSSSFSEGSFSDSRWVSTELEQNVSSNLLARWLAPGGEQCKDSKTVEIAIPGLDGRDSIELYAGKIHEFVLQALDDSGNPRCSGGDYFETDISGESWKSRPPIRDLGNGSYSFSLQVHPDFSGFYNFTVVLLFRHFEGLKFSPERFAFNKELRKIPIKFVPVKEASLPDLQTCKKSDFERNVWAGRWTRLGKNDDCAIGNDGRYRCLGPDFACRSPWCNGSLGLLESNGWVYSAHCSFRIFSGESAWNCLKNRWIFFWGDSNHVDTIRNLLNFVLDLPGIPSVPRRFDMNFTNPKDPSQSVRITSIFNGHSNVTMNYLGLHSLRDEEFRNLLKGYFSEETVPDTAIMNSGLHDGVFWKNLRRFVDGAEYAARFWADVMESVRRRGLMVPELVYRTTIATGGYARTLAFNPSKMEAFNWILLEKLKEAGLLSGVIDDFDLTYAWHFDNRCNDGVHYGRAPAKFKWRDGQIGHQYFVDLMLAHVLLNRLCPS